jgi:hypothetical protein
MLSKEDKQKIIDLCLNPNLSYADIGAQFGVGGDRVCQIRKAAGLPRRSSGWKASTVPPKALPKPEIRINAMPWITKAQLTARR